MIGDCSVGKTAILQRVTDCTVCESYEPTIGVDFKTKTSRVLSETSFNVTLQIWDSSGHERFSNVVRSYTRSYCVILVFDVTNAASFHRIRDYWANFISLQERRDKTTILVGNKCDLEESRIISTAQGIELALELGITAYLDVSATSGYNIDDAFAVVVSRKLSNL